MKGYALLFSFAFFLHNFIFAQSDSTAPPPKDNKSYNSASDIRTGERLFEGLIQTNGRTVNCASCHNLGAVDSLNWNPAAVDIAQKYKNKDFASFKAVLMQPSGKVMSKVHENVDLTNEQLHQIKSYMDQLAVRGEEPSKPLRTNRIIFIILIILFILAFVDFAITHKIRFKVIHVAVMLLTALGITHYIVTSAMALGRSKNYQPDQPIKFSHKVHAGDNKISCFYCHYGAEQSKFAGIPPANVCTNCHVLIKEGTHSGKYEIDKLYQAIDNNKPIRWVKVHNLPDHVFFSHEQHVAVGKIDCAKCHGDVAKMDQIKQVSDLSMGFCVNCHRQTAVQFNNKFYGKYEQLHKDMRSGKITRATAENIGGTDCMKCHY